MVDAWQYWSGISSRLEVPPVNSDHDYCMWEIPIKLYLQLGGRQHPMYNYIIYIYNRHIVCTMKTYILYSFVYKHVFFLVAFLVEPEVPG